MRKSILSAGIVVVVTLVVSLSAQAAVFNLQPVPSDLGDLDHSKYLTWGINWSIPQGEEIQSVSLFIDDLNDHTVETGDILYVHLLDEAQLGVRSWTDNENHADAFAGQGVLLTTYTDDDGWPNASEDWTYEFTAGQIESMTSYVANGRFGLGFDPDCHYYNNGVKLTITTGEYVPEPSMALMLAMAAGSVCLKRRRSA